MLGNPELERALLEQTYDGVMTRHRHKQTGSGRRNRCYTRRGAAREYPVCTVIFGHTRQQDRRKQRSDQLSGDDLLCSLSGCSGGLPHWRFSSTA